MKIHHSIVLSLALPFLMTLNGRGQTTYEAKYWNISKTLTTSNANYVARDYISFTPTINQVGGDLHFSIDPSLVFNADYFDPEDIPDPDERDIDVNLPVGTIAGQASVSQTGSANYTIPIAVPPGTAGMQPSLAVVYNSQGSNGILGMGWGLSGISAITRSPRTIYHDGYKGGVNFDINDQYVIDGQRLILKSGNHATNNAKYGTELEGFLDVKFVDTNGDNNADYFEVKNKQGWTMYYGNTGDSRNELGGSSGRLGWYLKKIVDNNGNFIEYEYTSDIKNGEIRINKIKYTGNDNINLSAYNEVEFCYDYRTDKSVGYIKGKNYSQTIILREIHIKCEEELVRKYRFNYSFDETTHLNEVVEYGRDGKQFNSTIMEWGGSSDVYTLTQGNNLDGSFLSYACDVNADGLTDLVKVRDWNYTSPADKSIEIYISDGTRFNYSATPGTIQFETLLKNYKGLYPGDYNGDGKEDIFIGRVSFNNTGSVNGFRGDLMYSNGTSLSFNSEKIYWHEDGHPTDNNYQEGIGDFNGDGITDILFVQTVCSVVNIGGTDYYAHTCRIYTGAPDNTFTSQVYYLAAGAVNHAMKKMRVADFNGDGLSDIMFLYDNGYKIHINTWGLPTDPGSMFTAGTWWSDTDLTDADYIDLGDFNGDGLPDLLLREGSTWKIRQNNGTRGFMTAITAPVHLLKEPTSSLLMNYDNYNSLIIADFNGDGRSDIWEAEERSNGGTVVRKAYIHFTAPGNGIVFSSHDVSASLDNLNALLYYSSIMAAGDFNGDGRTDIHLAGHIDEPMFYLSFRKNEKKHMVHTIADGLNNKYKFEYVSAAQTTTDYIKGSGATYPLNDIKAPLYLVRKLTSPNAKGANMYTYYKYEGAKYHKQGKGFLGFTKITSSNSTLNKKIASTFEINTTYYYPWLKETKVSTYSDSQLSKETHWYTQKVLNGKRIFPYPEKTESYNNLNGITVTSEFDFDNYGNLTSKKVTYPGSSLVVNNVNTYTSTGSWCNARILKSTVTRTLSGDAVPYTRYVDYTYYSNGNLYTTTSDNGVLISNTYYTTGNLNTVTTSASDMVTRSGSLQYDSKFRFVTRATNALGQYSSSTYNAATGNVLSETSVEGLTTTYTYDGFGRLYQTLTPEGHTITHSIAWESGAPVFGKMYYTAISAPGAPDNKTWYNGAGQAVQSETDGFNGKLYSDMEYNNDGSTYRVSDAYYSGETKKWTTYTYHSIYGYLQKQNYMGLLETTYSISGLSSTVTPPSGRNVTKVLNNWGKVASTTDQGGTVTYSYKANGQPESITTGGATLTMKYDTYGRQTELSDPNAGKTTYEYYKIGLLKKQTDAKNNVYTLVYDKLDRINTKTGPEGVYSWNYVPSGNGIGQLQSVTAPGNMETAYTYDEFGRMKSVEEDIQGEVITTAFQYDGYGNTTWVDYNSVFAVKKNYDANGYLTEVRRGDNNGLIWKGLQVNSRGQYTDCQLGTGSLHRLRQYDTYGLPQRITVGSNFDMGFAFNATQGQLTSRTDYTNNLTETFGYTETASLNRLTSFEIKKSGAVVNTIGMVYNNNGNILSKTDAAETYTYDDTKKHALNALYNSPLGGLPLQKVNYNSFNKVSSVVMGSDSLVFTYGTDQERRIMREFNGTTETSRKYYSINYEKTVAGANTKEVVYIGGGDGLAAVYIKENGTGNVYYTCADYLGSLLALTNAQGSIVERYNYDPWGRRRDPVTGQYITSAGNEKITRGFTGHEHLDKYGLINMNGRMYDPLVARFLSPDNYVQGDFTQAYNRYSYCFNNPLIYTDPSGEYIPLFLVPSISWSPQGGFGVSLTGGIGFYKGLSAQVTVGYDFKANNFYVGSGVSFLYLTTYNGWGTQTGKYAGMSFGLGSYNGFSSNLLSIGVNYSDNGGFSANISAWQYSSQTDAWSFNPSLSYSRKYNYIYYNDKNVYYAQAGDDPEVYSSIKPAYIYHEPGLYRGSPTSDGIQYGLTAAANGGNESQNEKQWRPYKLKKSDVEGLTGVAGGFALTAAAAAGNVPVVAAAATIVSNITTTAITVDAIFNYRDIKNPTTSDKAQLGLNLVNYGVGVIFVGWTIPSAVISIIDLNGGFNSFYEKFNK